MAMTSKQLNADTGMSETAMATIDSAHEEAHHSSTTNRSCSPNTVHATVGYTPPLRARTSSSLSKGSKSSKKKGSVSKRHKKGTIADKALDSKVSGARKRKPHLSLRKADAAAEPWKIEQAETAQTLSPGGTSDSLVTISKDTASTDEPKPPLFKKRGLSPSSSKRSNSPEQPANSAAKNKQSTAPSSPKQTPSTSNAAKKKQDERESGLFPSEYSRSKTTSFKKTSKVSRSKSRELDSSMTRKPGPRKGSNVDSSRFLDLLVANMRDITSEGGGAESSAEDSAISRLPFSTDTDNALPSMPPAHPGPPLPPAVTRDAPNSDALVTAKSAALDKGCELFEFTATVATGSLILVALLYLLQRIRSRSLLCNDYYNCTTANGSYPPRA